MPRARRRRSRSIARRGRGRTLFLVVLLASAAGLAVGSLVEIHAQSSDFRTSTNTGYGALASRVVDASNQTGAQLAGLMDKAPQLPNEPFPGTSRILDTARAEIQQGLDQAVNSATGQATRAADLTPPSAAGSVSARFTQVMSERATATSQLRSSIDRLLGMEPLPIAGAPSSSSPPGSAPRISINQAAAEMTAAGLLFQRADNGYRGLVAYVRQQRIPIHLPASVWVPSPIENAPLGSAPLGASASALDNSVALIPFHQLVITAVGLSPPAIASGGPGIVGVSCSSPLSTVPGSTPTVLPPTSSVRAAVTVTNCGTVVESGVVVRQTLTLADPAGTALPPAGARGGKAQMKVTLRSGSSVALSLPLLSVAAGHLYSLALAIANLPSLAGPAGSSQQFLLQISN